MTCPVDAKEHYMLNYTYLTYLSLQMQKFNLKTSRLNHGEKNSFMFLPSDLRDQGSKWFLPGVHLDDSNSRHHFVHCADSAVSQNCCFTPVKKS